MQAVQASREGQQTRLPEWATDLSVSLESGACGQFVLYGNVHDRFAVGDQFVAIDRFVEDEMLGATAPSPRRPIPGCSPSTWTPIKPTRKPTPRPRRCARR
jgi:hypothetical protein